MTTTERTAFDAWWKVFADTGYVNRSESIAWAAWKAANEHAQEIAALKAFVMTMDDKIEGPNQPAWHDAPTVPGEWLCNGMSHTIYEILPTYLPVGGWFGPIPDQSVRMNSRKYKFSRIPPESEANK